MNRMPIAAGIAVAFCVAALGAASAHAQAAGAKKKSKPAAAGNSVEDQIKKIENDRAAAVVKGDVATLEGLTSDDYTLINANGQLSTKAQTMNAIKTGDIKLTSNELSDLNVRVYGNTVVVTGKSNAKGTLMGREVKGPVLFTRVYVKKNGKWQSVAFQQTPIVAP
jgi:ketosteroid isomerase-like protein